jgi:pyrroloquinoline-quinone synthase
VPARMEDAEVLDLGLRRIVDGIVAPRRLLDHPFYVRWSRGELSRDELRAYAAQYRHFEAHLPSVLERAAHASDDAGLRDAALRNLADETAVGRAHLELFDGFLSALDATEEAPTPATALLLDTYDRQLSASAARGLAAVLAYEWQSAEVARSKAAGLREHYGLDGGAVEFWDVHAGVDGDHAAWLAGALSAAAADSTELEGAVRETCDAWLAFLDERQAAAA